MLDSFIVHAGVISDAPSIQSILFTILKFLLSLVAIVAILAIVIAGIRYMFLANTNQAAGVKKSLAGVIIGLFLVLGALVIIMAIGRILA